MKTILLLSILLCAIALPALGQLTDTDLDKIRLIIKEEVKEELEPIKSDIGSLKADIGSLKTESAWMRGKLEGIDKQVTHATNVTYGLIALIVAAVAIPQILIARRSERDRTLEKQIEILTEEVEKLKQQRIVNP